MAVSAVAPLLLFLDLQSVITEGIIGRSSNDGRAGAEAAMFLGNPMTKLSDDSLFPGVLLRVELVVRCLQ